MADALTTELEVQIDTDGEIEVFRFKMPSPRDLARINTRAETLRRKDDPQSGPSEDFFTMYLYRGFALLECIPFKADTKDNWPWAGDPSAPVDSSKFPPGTEFRVVDLYRGFSEALNRFHEGRTAGKRPADTEAVAGQ